MHLWRYGFPSSAASFPPPGSLTNVTIPPKWDRKKHQLPVIHRIPNTTSTKTRKRKRKKEMSGKVAPNNNNNAATVNQKSLNQA
ncbi:hypothetical protein TNCV_1923991 [Trichonephila clavipes]|nr:hypothetical protein TNCV_1923991 [Trichonephila clavipes]